jgi:RNA polymerase sigma factor (sigma-70 family)
MTTTQQPARRTRQRTSSHPPLSPIEQAEYGNIPDDLDFVDAPIFDAEDIEQQLWGSEADEIDVPQYQLFPSGEIMETSPRKHSSTVDRRQEKLLFYRYNYSRRRVRELIDAQDEYFSRKRAREAIAWYRRALMIREKIVHANLALVPAMASRKQVRDVDFRDLIAEGYLAVLRSVEKFDVSRGYKFSTYACRAILSSFQYIGTKAQRNRDRHPVEYEPGMETEDYGERRHRAEMSDTLDAVRDVLASNSANLTEIEQTVVMERFPVLTGQAPRTLAEIGREVGLTNERVRQIEKASLSKIRSVLEDELPRSTSF